MALKSCLLLARLLAPAIAISQSPGGAAPGQTITLDAQADSSQWIVDHLKNIPREMVEIVKRDPTTLDSYENFLVALRGPR